MTKKLRCGREEKNLTLLHEPLAWDRVVGGEASNQTGRGRHKNFQSFDELAKARVMFGNNRTRLTDISICISIVLRDIEPLITNNLFFCQQPTTGKQLASSKEKSIRQHTQKKCMILQAKNKRTQKGM